MQNLQTKQPKEKTIDPAAESSPEPPISTIPKQLVSRLLIYLFLSIMVVVALFPIVYIFLSSFKTNQEIMIGGPRIIPTVWQFKNYIRAWEIANFERYTYNSLYLAFFIVIGCILTATTAGYVFSRGKTRITKLIYYMVLSSLFVSIGTLSLYPQLTLAKAFGLSSSLWGVIIIRVFGMNVTQVFLATSFINQIPKELDESAKIDGCGFFRTFAVIILPLLKPLVATIGLISFRLAWNDYLLPFVFTISKPDRMPLTVGVVNLKASGYAASSWDLALAGISISLLPMLIVYLILNRFFVSGLTEGSIKG
ncbi:carbohydrate ABC transporter permease [Marispirochaeta aestuarii]|uniref:carbohydrate ABC transporter permease n=1 Tax=Marispirochaeta aestuarii TaxID=1963862 RepID=UPI0029C841D4|nr:carbohydrate ABC transporter permease [Marispirochaeta aestuarii]